MGNRYRLISLPVVVVTILVAFASQVFGVTLEDFEAYLNGADLNAAWAPSPNGAEGLELTTVFEGQKSMEIVYNCGAGDFSTVYTYDVAQDWTSYTTFSVMYLGTAASSGERLAIELRDPWGGFVKGASVLNASQALVWTEYSMDISGWANREWVKEVKILIEADSWGNGTMYFDYLVLPTAISVDDNTWSRIKAIYGGKKIGH